jgi:hypothetical protein
MNPNMATTLQSSRARRADGGRRPEADEVLDLVEERGVRYLLAVIEFDCAERYVFHEVREARSTSRRVPL